MQRHKPLKPPPKYSITTMQWREKLFGHFNFLGLTKLNLILSICSLSVCTPLCPSYVHVILSTYHPIPKVLWNLPLRMLSNISSDPYFHPMRIYDRSNFWISIFRVAGSDGMLSACWKKVRKGESEVCWKPFSKGGIYTLLSLTAQGCLGSIMSNNPKTTKNWLDCRILPACRGNSHDSLE